MTGGIYKDATSFICLTVTGGGSEEATDIIG